MQDAASRSTSSSRRRAEANPRGRHEDFHFVTGPKVVIDSTTPSTTTMPREIEPPTVQREFLVQALEHGKRLDGRLPLEQRPFELSFGAELGSVECRMGKTA